MDKIRNVAVIGAGAMGAFFATRFFDTPGFSTVLIARGRRLERLRCEGLIFNAKHYALEVIDPDEAARPMDLVIVAVKQHQLEEAVRGLDNIIGDSTVIMSIMNGLTSEEYIGSLYGMDRMLYTVSVAIDTVRRDNRITSVKPGKHFFGEKDNRTISPQVRRVQEAFDRAGIDHETPEDMMRTLWWKLMINVGINQTSAVMRAPYGVVQKSPEARALMEALMKEVVALAGVMDINPTERDIEEWYTILNNLSPGGKTSMLQDIEAGRKTEVELFGGTVVDLGKKHGIPVPVNQTVLRIIRVLEGRFE